MKIGIDGRFVLKNRRGIGNYSLHLITYLATIDRINQYIIYTDCPDNFKILPIGENVKLKVIRCSIYFYWEQVLLPFHLLFDEIDLFHSLGNTGPLLISSKIKYVLTLHDVIFLNKGTRYISLYQRFGNLYRKFLIKHVCKKANAIISVSQFTKADILNYLNINPDKIHVIHESYNESLISYFPKKSLQKEHFLLAMGSEEPRKNNIFLITAFSNIIKKHNFRLKLVGFKNWNRSKVKAFAKSINILDQIDVYDFISDKELVELYKKAFCFVYPSLFEGFGIPPLEAMICGCPVVCSNITSIPEIVANNALLFDPYSEKSLNNAIETLINDPHIYNDLIVKGERHAKNFSWEKTARMTFKLYINLLNNNGAKEG